MKVSQKVIDSLNSLLMDEFTAQHEYELHAEMCKRWGYSKLAQVISDRATKEKEHAHEIMEHILLLDGKPYVAQIGTIDIGKDVKTILTNDLKLEVTARDSYNKAIELACSEGDDGSAEVMRHNLREEEDHIFYIKSLLDQIDQMGMDNFLSTIV
jgi:bacterioferritin